MNTTNVDYSNDKSLKLYNYELLKSHSYGFYATIRHNFYYDAIMKILCRFTFYI